MIPAATLYNWLSKAETMSLNHGYRVVRVQFGSAAVGAPVDFITGFLHEGKVYGRPVDIMNLGPALSS